VLGFFIPLSFQATFPAVFSSLNKLQERGLGREEDGEEEATPWLIAYSVTEWASSPRIWVGKQSISIASASCSDCDPSPLLKTIPIQKCLFSFM
jgi:hypothetical protein